MNYYPKARALPRDGVWRMCCWKLWHYARSNVRNFLKSGTSKRQVIMTGISRKESWYLARTLTAQTGMIKKWLAEQGLIFVKEQWVKIH